MARTKTTGRVFKSKALSIDPKLLADAEARARALRMNFSDYVRQCLIKDIYRGGAMTIMPLPPEDEAANGSHDVAPKKKHKTG